MHTELEQCLRSAGIDEFTPVDTALALQTDGRAFLAVDYEEQYDLDDLLERCAGGESPWLSIGQSG